MVVTQHRSKRSVTGARYIKSRHKRQFETGSVPTLTKLGARKHRSARILGGSSKQRLLAEEKVNLANPKTKKVEVVKIKSIVENKANRHFVRRNIITKGAIIETEKGKARVTSCPGQEGSINAVLVE